MAPRNPVGDVCRGASGQVSNGYFFGTENKVHFHASKFRMQRAVSMKHRRIQSCFRDRVECRKEIQGFANKNKLIVFVARNSQIILQKSVNVPNSTLDIESLGVESET